MPATKKQSGYLVKIEAFVPADMTDIGTLTILQKMVAEAKDKIGSDAVTSITPTRR